MQTQVENFYESESAANIVSDLFSGQLSLEQALQRLRTRLLDLSSRNRLISYRHPKGRSISFVDEPNLNLVYTRLIDSKSLFIKYVPDPPTDSYTLKKPDVKSYAQSLGINTDTEFSPNSCKTSANKHTPKLQALNYPVDLDKLCRKVSSEARTVIEETGTNMLYLVFGFLEFYERDDSEKPMLSPLLAVPVTLEKGPIDIDTRTYQYSIVYSGEDVHENQTLREKLRQDFTLNLPDFEEEDEPGSYFAKIKQAILKKKRWEVRYQLTLGFLSFGKLAIWDDLDPKKWPGLLRHSLLQEVFSGGSGKGASLFPEDYEIDKHPQADLPVIYDADSSQHSAIIDVLSGKNLVINGPPGTGKSQTITNVIAAGLREGKKILFVSEKLAALEVVRHRLNQANLGYFCLELHSHKTQKKKLLSEIQERLDERFRFPIMLNDKMTTLQRHKRELNRYAELMSLRVGNELGLTIHEVFWRNERQRQIVGEFANAVQSLFLADASKWSYDDIELRRAKLETLGQLYDAIGTTDSSHPWWGFIPNPLAPGDDEAISRIISETKTLAEQLVLSVLEYQETIGDSDEPALDSLERILKALETLPPPPDELKGELLPRIFNAKDPLGKHSKELLSNVIRKVERARELNAKADSLLEPGCELTYDAAESLIVSNSLELTPSTLTIPLDDLAILVDTAEHAARQFGREVSNVNFALLSIQPTSLENIETKLNATKPLSLIDQPVHSIRAGVTLLSQETSRLEQSLNRVAIIANRRSIEFDGSPATITQLGRPDGIEGVLSGVFVDDAVISTVQKASEYFLSDLPLSELVRLHQELHSVHDKISRALNEIGSYAKQLGVPFDGSQSSLIRLKTLGQIAFLAPADLLDYRQPSLAHPRTIELLNAAEDAQHTEESQRNSLNNDFYLDALPTTEEIKTAIRTFRRGDSLFNFLNSEWRAAKKLYHGISKTKTKRKATEYESHISSILKWIEHRDSFIGNNDFKESFGPLFKGLDTDYSKISRLHNWYVESHAEILKHPGFVETVNLSTFESQKIVQLAALSSRIREIFAELNNLVNAVSHLLPPMSTQLESLLQQAGWEYYKNHVLQITENLKSFTTQLEKYVKSEISPKRAVEILNAKLELTAACTDFDALNNGLEAIHGNLEPLLPGITSIPCLRWRDYLLHLTELANSTAILGESLHEYGDSDSTPRSILTFIESKIALDLGLAKFAPLPERTSTHNWESYVRIATSRVDSADCLVKLLRPAGIAGLSTEDIMTGLRARKDAAELIDNLSSDASVVAVLQGLFQGIETDLASLAATLSWGGAVIGDRAVKASSLSSILLCESATTNFQWVKNHLSEIIELNFRTCRFNRN